MTTTPAVAAKTVATKHQRVFARTFGIPGFIFALLSAWFTVMQTFVAMTATGASEIILARIFRFSLAEIINIPVLALCFCAFFWACFAIVSCVLSRYLGISTKLNQAGFIISFVSVICSTSLACFSIVYMILV